MVPRQHSFLMEKQHLHIKFEVCSKCKILYPMKLCSDYNSAVSLFPKTLEGKPYFALKKHFL